MKAGAAASPGPGLPWVTAHPRPPAPAGVVGACRCCARGAHHDTPGPLLLWVLGDHLVGLLSVSLVGASWLLAGPWTSQLACHADPSDWVGQEPSPADSRPAGPGPSTPALGPQPRHTPRPCFLPRMATCRAWRRGPRHRLKGTHHTRAQPPWGWENSDQGSLARSPGSPGKRWGKREPGQKHAEARAAETRAQACRRAHTQRGTRATAQLRQACLLGRRLGGWVRPWAPEAPAGASGGPRGLHELATCDPRRTTRGWALWLPSLPARPLLSRGAARVSGGRLLSPRAAGDPPSPGRRPAPVPHPGVTPVTQSLNLQLPEPAHPAGSQSSPPCPLTSSPASSSPGLGLLCPLTRPRTPKGPGLRRSAGWTLMVSAGGAGGWGAGAVRARGGSPQTTRHRTSALFVCERGTHMPSPAQGQGHRQGGRSRGLDSGLTAGPGFRLHVMAGPGRGCISPVRRRAQLPGALAPALLHQC